MLKETTLALIGGAGLLLSQVAVPSVDGFDLPNMTAQGFTLWYAWYVTCRVIPKVIDKTEAINERQRAEHAADREKFKCHSPAAQPCDPGASRAG